MSLRVGEVYKLKTTGENVLLVEVRGSESGANEVDVRRARMTKDGIIHSLETFLPIELHSIYDELKKDMEFKLEEFKARYQLQLECSKFEGFAGPKKPEDLIQ